METASSAAPAAPPIPPLSTTGLPSAIGATEDGPRSPRSPPSSPSKGGIVYKVILIGSAAVGKTNLLSVAARGQQFDARSEPTLQPEFVTVRVKRPDWKFGEPNEYIRAQVWDTAGQERFQAISSSHYRRANGALIVYDVSKKATFKDVYSGSSTEHQWLRSLKANVDPNVLAAVMLVENKSDKLNPRVPERPAEFVQDSDVQRMLKEVVFREPKFAGKSVSWLQDANESETIPYRIANSLMFARTSAVTNSCELYEYVETTTDYIPDLLRSIPKKKIAYERTLGVSTVSQALDALILRIYERSKDMHAGGSKVSGQAFKLMDKQAEVAPSTSSGCC